MRSPDASLTLRASDLHAVSCTLRFGAQETVEITEVPDEQPAPHVTAQEPNAAAIQPAPEAVPRRPASPGDELLAIAALHRIGADLGEPIEIRRDGESVLVNASGMEPRRQAEVKAALSGIAAVRLTIGDFASSGAAQVERRPTPQVDTADRNRRL